MSNACDPRNRPGFVSGDLTSYLPHQVSPPSTPPDDLRTVLLTGFSAALLVAVVFAVVLFVY
jgi:hypothetical protein